MLVLLKVWSFLKNYWYVPLCLIGAILLYVFLQKGNAKKVLDIALNAFKKERELNEQLSAEEEKLKEDQKQKYDLLMKELEAQYNIKKEDLEEEKKERIKELLEKDPKDLTKLLAKEFGLTNIDEESEK